MANKQRGERTLMMRGAEFVLRYDMNALAELEDISGMSLAELAANPSSAAGPKFLRAAVYAGLIHRSEKGLTLMKVGRLLDPSKLGEISEAVSGAMMDALGVSDDAGAEVPADPLAQSGAEA